MAKALPKKEDDGASNGVEEGEGAKVIVGGGVAAAVWQEDASHQQEIDANIRARAGQQRAEATLESKDGCAGDNYECKRGENNKSQSF